MRLNNTAFKATFPTFYLGIAAAFQLIAFFLYFNVQPNWLVVAMFFIATTGTYLLNRISDKEDKFNNILRWNFFNGTKSKTFIWTTVSIVALIVPIVFSLSMEKYDTAFLFAVIAIIGFIYTIKVLPISFHHSIRWISLKDIPVGKSLIVCIIWAGSALAIAATFIDIKNFQVELLLLFITIFIGTCNSTITSDALDVIGDKMRNVLTLPGMIGLKPTFIILNAINLIGISIVVFLTVQSCITPKLATFSISVILWAALSTIPQYFFTDRLPKTLNELLIDSHLLLTALGLIAFGIFQH
jgi:uncharacterized membrane protein YwzB